MISLGEGVRIEQPMAKPALIWVVLIFTGVITSGAAILIGSVIIVALDLALPWKVRKS